MNMIRTIAITLVLAMLGISQAAAQDTLLDYVLDACEGDLQQFCSQVTPGEGRLLHCVAAHEDKISGECGYALYSAANLLAQLADAIVEIAESCEVEIDTLCGDVALGEGRILSCLAQNEAALGDACKTVITRHAAQ